MDFSLVGTFGGGVSKTPLAGCRYAPSNNIRALRVGGNLVGLILGFLDRSDAAVLSWRTMKADAMASELADSRGSFACLLDCNGQLVVMTDHSGSIPVYSATEDGFILMASRPDDVASLAKRAEFDVVSIADFIANGAVCHPFTFFEGVTAFPPGSISRISALGCVTRAYWEPREERSADSLSGWGQRLRETVREALHKPLAEARSANVMFSGGEDSRVLATMLPPGPKYHLVTVVDRPNRELRLASRAAKVLKLPLRSIRRPEGFYRDSIDSKVRMAGSGMDTRHYHFFGPMADAAIDAEVLVGGLGSDKLFKSLFMRNVNKRRGLPDSLDGLNPDTPTHVKHPADLSWMAEGLVSSVWERRSRHHDRIKAIRPLSAGNWHTLWPLGGHSPGHSQYLNNLRLGPRIIEPFFSSQSYRVASALPEGLRIDRKAFVAAFRGPLGISGWMPTSSGRLPAIRGPVGQLAQIFVKRQRQLIDTLRARSRGGALGSQGSWNSDHAGFYFDFKQAFSPTVFEKIMNVLESIVPPNCFSVDWKDGSGISLEQRVRVLQVAHVLSDVFEAQRVSREREISGLAAVNG